MNFSFNLNGGIFYVRRIYLVGLHISLREQRDATIKNVIEGSRIFLMTDYRSGFFFSW